MVKYSSLFNEPCNICFAYSYSEKHTEDLLNPAVVIMNIKGCLLAHIPDSRTFKSSLSGCA